MLSRAAPPPTDEDPARRPPPGPPARAGLLPPGRRGRPAVRRVRPSLAARGLRCRPRPP